MNYYKSRYKRDSIKAKWHLLLIKGLKFIYKTKFRKILSGIDLYEIKSHNRTRDFNKIFLEQSTKDIQLQNIEFLEVIEIDKLDKVEKQIDKIIKKYKFFTLRGKGKKLPAAEISKIKSNLDKFKKSFNTASEGRLFELINENQSTKNDLYEYINFSYFKTFENLFILSLDIKPSKKFFQILQEIRNNKTIPTDKIIIAHFKDFLRTKRIISGFMSAGYQKEIAFNNLIYDLNYQLKKSFISGFNGIFSNKKTISPHITYFNTKESVTYDDLIKGFGIIRPDYGTDLYYDYGNSYFLLCNSNLSNNIRSLHVIADNDMFSNESDDKNISKYCLSNTIFITWGILNYLQKTSNELNSFRKTIYNFINSKGKTGFRNQIQIKSKLTIQKIKIKRIQKEFTQRNIHFYLTNYDYDSKQFHSLNFGWSRETNFHKFSKEQIEFFIKDYNSQIIDLDDYFNEISSINLLRLNFNFQLIVISLTFLSLILALASAENIIKLIKKLFELIS